jgi:hypothetical protein
VTYVEGYADEGSSAVAAARVFGEFADLLERHTLTMLLLGADAAALRSTAEGVAAALAEAGPPAGLVVTTAPGPLPDTLGPALASVRAAGSPIFGWFDARAPTPVVAVSIMAGNKSSELLLALPSSVPDRPYQQVLTEAGLGLICQAELVDASAVAQRLVFATSSAKNLEKFKDELWALDEYAGIQLRDPIDEERTLLDISVQPQLGPLRRALAARVSHTGGSTVAELRAWALRETMFRAADATRAVQALVTSGAVTREPTAGRLSPTTMIRPTGNPEAPVGRLS